MQHVDAFAIFAKVGELESISGAARALGLPKAKVSRAVTRLEAAYKIALIDRTSRRVRLTEVGRTFHAHCIRVLEVMEEAEGQIAAHRGLPIGTLRLGCPGDVARDLIAPNLGEFLDRYPDLDLRIRVGERLIPEPNGIDLVLHAGWLADSRLIVQKLADIETVLVASRTYVEEHGLPQSIEDLPEHAILGNFYLHTSAAEIGRLPAYVPVLELAREGERYVVPIWSRFASTDHSLMLNLVERGKAIAPVAASRAIKRLQSGDFVRVLPEYELHNQPALYALYTERVAVAPKLQVLLNFISEVIDRERAEAIRLYGSAAISQSAS